MNEQELNEKVSTEEVEDDAVELATVAVEAIWDAKGKNAVAIDLRGQVTYTDIVVICTATSDRHMQAVARRVEDDLQEVFGITPMGREGAESSRWVLIDFGDLILHVFNGEAREVYNLEQMWADAPRLTFEDPPKDLYGHFELDRFSDQ